MPLGGVQVGSFDSYEQAQAAVDHLSDQKFPVENVTIIGSDLRQVERVTGRLTWGRVLVMEGGRIVEDGSPADLVAGTGRFAALHQAWADSLV